MQPALRNVFPTSYYLLPDAPPVLLPGLVPGAVPGLPAPGAGAVLLPELMPPELEPPAEPPVPVLPGVEVLGAVPPVLAPPVVPLELLPLVMFSSLRHFSRSGPTMPRHLLLLLPLALPEDDAPPEALSDDPVELLPLALGVELLLPAALGVLLLELPVALGVLEPVELLPVALGVLDPALLPVLPEDEPELCANEAPAIAKSAAAVAVTTSFNFTVGPPKEKGGEDCSRTYATSMPGTRLP
jgi:hypothetical protein